MAQQAIRNGIIVLNKRINAKNVEKEQLVCITPCYNCFSYDKKHENVHMKRKTYAPTVERRVTNILNAKAQSQSALTVAGNIVHSPQHARSEKTLLKKKVES